jgi:RES domain-containing protein
MPCCAECFGDREIRKNLIPAVKTVAKGNCTYCGSTNVKIVEPAELADVFKLVIGAYLPAAGGRTLVQIFREDWGLFGHTAMTDARASVLIQDILEDTSAASLTLTSPPPGSNRLSDWERLRNELMYKNRFFPDANMDLDRLDNLLSYLKIDPDEVPAVWYRARIQPDDVPFAIDKMGPPPGRTATHGRANPAGIPYLYLGSIPETAIAETRPHTGETVCVADFRTPADLSLVDLRDPRRVVSPFILADSGGVAELLNDLPFLERLGEELTRPVLPQAAAIDYTPSQYLCEYIKKKKYDGVLYRSSVSTGMNLALFDPARATGGTVVQHRVNRVSVESSPVTPAPLPAA